MAAVVWLPVREQAPPQTCRHETQQLHTGEKHCPENNHLPKKGNSRTGSLSINQNGEYKNKCPFAFSDELMESESTAAVR